MSAAPHLPPKSCDLRARHAWQTLPMLLFVIVVAIIVSVAMAAVTVTWIVPFSESGTLSYSSLRAGTTLNSEAPSEDVRPFVIARVWQLYDTGSQTAQGFYPQSYQSVPVALISSDGWAVLASDQLGVDQRASYEVIDHHGRRHVVEDTYTDDVSGFTYIRIGGVSDAPFFRFANWNNLEAGNTLWHLGQQQLSRQVLSEISSLDTETPYAAWQQVRVHMMPEPGVMVTLDGELVGVVSEQQHLIPSWYIDNQYRDIVSEGQTNYLATDWQGFFVQGPQTVQGGTATVEGFYIAARPQSGPLRVGDIITKLNGEAVSSARLPNQLFYASTPINITVLRDGTEYEFSVEKTTIVR